jgi:hypothetical protein
MLYLESKFEVLVLLSPLLIEESLADWCDPPPIFPYDIDGLLESLYLFSLSYNFSYCSFIAFYANPEVGCFPKND